jgi:DnaK suppressor protein
MAKASVKKSPAKKSPAKHSVPKKSATKKPAVKKPAAKKPVAKKAPTKKVAAKKPAAKTTAPKKLAAKKIVVKKAPAKAIALKKPEPQKKLPVKKSMPAPTQTTAAKKAITKAAPPAKAAPAAPKIPAKPKVPYKPVKLAQGYKPTEKEPYMNPHQLEYFRQKLLAWRAELLAESRETLEHLTTEEWHQADIADRASLETEAGVELRTRNRYLKLISKIDSAIRRIEEGEYGYCEDTGEEIGLKRLEARPVVTRTTEAQERYEKLEKQYTDED